MNTRSIYTLFIILTFTFSSEAQAQNIEGAWKLERYQFEGETMKGEVNPAQASLFLFTQNHYSITYTLGDKPRVPLPATPSSEDIAVAFRSFVSNSGSYKIKDATLITHPIITRNPNVTSENASTVLYTYSIQQDTLHLTLPEAPGDVKVRVDYVLSRIKER